MAKTRKTARSEAESQRLLDKSNANWAERKARKPGWKNNPYWFEKHLSSPTSKAPKF